MAERCQFARAAVIDPLLPRDTKTWPYIDLSLVTHNSALWLEDLFKSLLEQRFPTERINICVVDNSSTDRTVAILEEILAKSSDRFASCKVLQQANRGFGAGHNLAFAATGSEFLLVVNPDVTFEPGSIAHIVAIAQADEARVACWELRQRPFEHPKIYDPVTGLTNWNSYACALLRRSALDEVGGFDEKIFMYGKMRTVLSSPLGRVSIAILPRRGCQPL